MFHLNSVSLNKRTDYSHLTNCFIVLGIKALNLRPWLVDSDHVSYILIPLFSSYVTFGKLFNLSVP